MQDIRVFGQILMNSFCAKIITQTKVTDFACSKVISSTPIYHIVTVLNFLIKTSTVFLMSQVLLQREVMEKEHRVIHCMDHLILNCSCSSDRIRKVSPKSSKGEFPCVKECRNNKASLSPTGGHTTLLAVKPEVQLSLQSHSHLNAIFHRSSSGPVFA
jgi:hypothetical protein